MDDQLKAFLDKFEGHSSKVYKDIKDIPTIGRGVNLNVPGTDKILREQQLDPAKVRSGQQQLTPEQVEATYNKRLGEIDNIVQSRRKKKFPNAVLSPAQENTIRSLAFNSPKLIGPRLSRYLNDNNYNEAAKEIMLRSNKDKTPGIQRRRIEEAKMFMGSQWQDFVDNLSDVEKRQIKATIDKIENEHTRKQVYTENPWLMQGASPRFNRLR